MKRRFLFAAAALVAALSVGCATLDERQREWIFQPSDRAWGGTAELAEGMAPVWIEAAINGPWGRERQPAIPVAMSDIIAEGIAAAKAGAAIIHLHVYDEATGRQTDDWQVYASPADVQRLARLDSAWEAGLKRARAEGHEAELDALGALAQPAGGLTPRVQPAPGQYRCRRQFRRGDVGDVLGARGAGRSCAAR